MPSGYNRRTKKRQTHIAVDSGAVYLGYYGLAWLVQTLKTWESEDVMRLIGKIVLCIVIVFVIYFVGSQIIYLFYQHHFDRQTTIRAKQVVSQLKTPTNGTNGNTCTNWADEAGAERMDETRK